VNAIVKTLASISMPKPKSNQLPAKGAKFKEYAIWGQIPGAAFAFPRQYLPNDCHSGFHWHLSMKSAKQKSHNWQSIEKSRAMVAEKE